MLKGAKKSTFHSMAKHKKKKRYSFLNVSINISIDQWLCVEF